MGDTKRKKVLAISSGGGHFIELIRLEPAFEGHDVVYVTVDEAYRQHLGTRRCASYGTRPDGTG